jgi:hypothetical protein
VDASLKAIETHVKSGAEMVLYSVNAISGSTESQGEVTVRLQNSGRVVNGVGADPDIVVASAKAYLHALNKLQSKENQGRGQTHQCQGVGASATESRKAIQSSAVGSRFLARTRACRCTSAFAW